MTRLERLEAYGRLLKRAADASPEHYREVERQLCRTDLFYLLVFGLKRKDCNKDWVYARCAEVQASPNGFLDLWSREHFKSTIITFALTIQDILNDPEITIGIFSFNRPTAKAFLRQIKGEFERNEHLKALFPEILWADPENGAPKWSEDDGLIVRRKGNPKESTLEAWGLVDGQPTSKHFRGMIFDDVVTKDSVGTPEMIKKVTTSWEAALNLTSEGGWMRYIGTRWAHNDTYREILLRQAAKPRIYGGTHDGTEDGEPFLWTREQLIKKRREMGPYTFASQILQNPTADKKQGFKRDWLRYYTNSASTGDGQNIYLLCDPANAKKKESDYTAMAVIGLGTDGNYYLLDGLRDRLNLTERWDALLSLHRRWRPNGVGYEQYGMQSDIQHFQSQMGHENYRFEITPLGGKIAKPDRIRRLVPIFESGRFLLPEVLLKTDYEGKVIDLVQAFIEEEYVAFPVGLHEDFFDAIARIEDEELGVAWPKSAERPDRYARAKPRRHRPGSSWAA
jgi:phage terminase large subunit-like protein